MKTDMRTIDANSFPHFLYYGFAKYYEKKSEEKKDLSKDLFFDELFSLTDVQSFFGELCEKNMYCCALSFLLWAFTSSSDSDREYLKQREYLTQMKKTLSDSLGEKGERVILAFENLVADYIKTRGAYRHRYNCQILAIAGGIIKDIDALADADKIDDIKPEELCRIAKLEKEKSEKEECWGYLGVLDFLIGLLKQVEYIAVDDNESAFDAGFDMMENCILPEFDKANWLETENVYVRMLYAECMEYLKSFLNFRKLCAWNFTYQFSPDKEENDESFLSFCRGNDFLFEDGQKIFAERKNLARLMCSVYEKFKDSLPDYTRKDVGYDLGSVCSAMTIYMLWCAGEEAECERFLIHKFDELAMNEKRILFIQIILIRCVLKTDNIRHADILNGYFNYEASLNEIEKTRYLSQLAEIANAFTKVREYFQREDRSGLYKLLYENGALEETEKELLEHCERGELIGYTLWRKVHSVVQLFAPEEIKPHGLNQSGAWSPEYKWETNYLSNPIEENLREQFDNSFRPFIMDEYKSVTQCMKFADAKAQIDAMIIDHIDELLGREVCKLQETIAEIKSENRLNQEQKEEIAAMNKELEAKQKELEELAEAEETRREEIESREEELRDKINEILGGNENYIKMYEEGKSLRECITKYKVEKIAICRNDINDMQRTFTRTYCEGEIDLLQKLDSRTREEVLNDIITSEIVYEYLRKMSEDIDNTDNVKFDFSAAVISLTKALEKVLNKCIFEKIPKEKFDINYDRKYYLRQTSGPNNSSNPGDYEKKNDIELGTCAYLFDGENPRENRRRIRGRNRRENYERLGVSDIVEIQRLASENFQELRLRTGKRENDISCFNGNDDHNRELLGDAIYYVSKEYRNQAAHPGHEIGMHDYEACKEIILQSYNLLWILLYIVR